jgi:hypothetical protein
MRALRPLLIPLLLGLALLTVAIITRTGVMQRDNPGLPINSAMREAMGQVSFPPADLELVSMRYPKAVATTSGLRYVVDQPGAGEKPRRSQYLSIHYREQLLDGTTIGDSYARGEGPFNFQLGQRQVMPGWEEAAADMQKGEKRTLIVPYWLAYGEKGVRGRVPPKATLVVELELVDIR